MSSSYYAIIPADVRYSKGICANAKLLYGEITALANAKGFCWATNSYFAELYDVSERSVQVWLSELKDNGFIVSDVEKNGKRLIYIKEVGRNLQGGMKKSSSGGGTKVHPDLNNTDNNTNKVAGEKVETEVVNPENKIISEIIHEFRHVNPMYAQFYSRPPQRKAVQALLETEGEEKLKQVMEVLPITNKMPYGPTIDSPVSLMHNIGKLYAFIEKEKAKLQSNGMKVHW